MLEDCLFSMETNDCGYFDCLGALCSNSSEVSGASKFSIGAIVGIVIGSIIGVIILIFCCKKCYQSQKN